MRQRCKVMCPAIVDEVSGNFSNAFAHASVSSPVSETRRRNYLLLGAVGLALLLRLHGISLYPLEGDEYGSIREAHTLGLNWNSILYSTLMHFWVRLGTSELWLRLPAAIFGTATVFILGKAGEKLCGWRTGIVAALLAATSPFSIYHSQELRFYSWFILMSAAFMLMTLSHRENAHRRWPVWIVGILLLLSHFLGALAVYAQVVSTALASASRRSKPVVLLLMLVLPAVGCALLMTSPVRTVLWRFYGTYANAAGSVEPASTSLSVANFIKAAFAGYIFIFGYHVYPLRLVLVTAGIAITGVLLFAGIRTLFRETKWGGLSFSYPLTLVVVYVVLDSVGGRVAAGVSPRHVAFVWPAFLLVVAVGLASFSRPMFQLLLVAMLALNAVSLWSGLQKNWTYGAATDYRDAASYAAEWLPPNAVILHDGRSEAAIDFYFPREAARIEASTYLQGRDISELYHFERLVLVTDDWQPERRQAFDRLLARLSERYACIDGHVDYPFFEYLLERKALMSDSAQFASITQLPQPLEFYGLEFQDLKLPISLNVGEVPLKIIGGVGLSNVAGRNEVVVPVQQPQIARRLILISNAISSGKLPAGETIAEVVIEGKEKGKLRFPLRLGNETNSWDERCSGESGCQTVFQWHKRLVIAGHSGFAGSRRDFAAGLHATILELPAETEVAAIAIHYLASSGQLYIWGIALAK
jgi:hypothetical protein